MADFETRVEAITGLTVVTHFTTSELTEYLKDGVNDVTNRIILLRPQDALSFTRSSSESTSQGGLSNSLGKVISVQRESGTDGDWRDCRAVSISRQSRLTDKDSLSYASKYNPAYCTGGDGSLLVFPVPASGGANSYKFYYVNSTPVDDNDATLLHSHSNINYFPEDRVYLVVAYAGVKCLTNALAAKNTTIETSLLPSDLSLESYPVPPEIISAPSFSGQTVSSTTISIIASPPTFTAPTVSGDGTELTSISDLDTDNVIDEHLDQIEFDQWWSVASHLIEGEEDIDLAAVQLQKISAYLQAYQQQLAANSADFQKESIIFGAELERAKVQAEIDATKAVTDAQLAQATEQQQYAAEINKYTQDIVKYSAEVQRNVTTNQNSIQNFTSKIQKAAARLEQYKIEYGWMEGRLMKLQQEYDSAFAIMGSTARKPEERG